MVASSSAALPFLSKIGGLGAYVLLGQLHPLPFSLLSSVVVHSSMPDCVVLLGNSSVTSLSPLHAVWDSSMLLTCANTYTIWLVVFLSLIRSRKNAPSSAIRSRCHQTPRYLHQLTFIHSELVEHLPSHDARHGSRVWHGAKLCLHLHGCCLG